MSEDPQACRDPGDDTDDTDLEQNDRSAPESVASSSSAAAPRRSRS
jgi:hypothetical protein